MARNERHSLPVRRAPSSNHEFMGRIMHDLCKAMTASQGTPSAKETAEGGDVEVLMVRIKSLGKTGRPAMSRREMGVKASNGRLPTRASPVEMI